MMPDNEIPLPKLARKARAFDPDNNRVVSESVQGDREVVNSWCRNILADHPSRSKSSDHGEEVSGEIGVPAVAIRTRSAMLRARVSPRDAINLVEIADMDLPDVFMALDFRPVALKDFDALLIVFQLPSAFHSGSLKAEIRPADPRE